MIGFRKPGRRPDRAGQRRPIAQDSGDEEEAETKGQSQGNNGDRDEEDLDEVQSRIAKFKEKKGQRSAGVGKALKSTSKSKTSAAAAVDMAKVAAAAPLLSFGVEDDAGETFQVKKSSQSRRIMKQKKADKKAERRRERVETEDSPPSEKVVPRLHQEKQPANVIEEDMDIKFKDTLPQRRREEGPASWTLSGREAEALHMEDDDDEDEDDKQESETSRRGASGGPHEPLRDILQSGAIPDAAAIHAARKRRQAAREKGDANGDGARAGGDYIPIRREDDSSGGQRSSRGRRLDRDEDDSGEDEDRINFTGVRSGAKDRQLRREELNSEEGEEDDDDEKDEWEEQQIRKAMGSLQTSDLPETTAVVGSGGPVMLGPQGYPPILGGYPSALAPPGDGLGVEVKSAAAMKKPVAYNLQGIKSRLKDRLSSLQEVHRRHQSDADRAADDLIHSQAEIEKLETCIPDLSERHKFYQELRGYVTDLVECYNEKIVNITYLEDKLNKSKAQITEKLMERRREDVRDQIIELSSKPPDAGGAAADAGVAEAARQRRSAEREGRRRRRQQARAKLEMNQKAKHNNGDSSDDELSSLEQAALGKARKDVETQARQTLSDVVEDFSTITGVKDRMEAWKGEDPDSYGDAYVSLCLPKVFSPLVRMQLLFWNPMAEKNDIDHMEWYRSLATFYWAANEDEESLASDPDRRLLSTVVEKVVVPKMTGLIKSAYDPLSTSQTVQMTVLLKKFVEDFPTLKGDSRQVRELLTAVKDKIKASVDNDPYIPIGYSKQVMDNPSGPHAAFVRRQFWITFKLLRNCLCWHGLLGDKLLAELALSQLLNRYLLTALGINPDFKDVVDKARRIVSLLPLEWRETGVFTPELTRLAGYLRNLGEKVRGVGREGIQEVIDLLKYIGFAEDADAIKRKRL